MASLNPLPGTLGRRRAAHLLRRTSFRYTRARVDQLAALSAAAALDDLLVQRPLSLSEPVFAASPGATPATWINPPQPPNTPLPADDDLLRRYVMAWWVNEALLDEGAGHRMELFWHQFLCVAADSGTSMEYHDHLMLLRWGALGNFKTLVTKIVTDNCMLRYIDNNQNYVNNPNENFAREFFELHTIGRGDAAGPGDYTTYTEDDIVEAARVLTGFNNAFRVQYTDPDTMLPSGKGYPQSHDFGPKTFSPRFAGASIQPAGSDEAAMFGELNALVDMVFAQPETARNLCRRLYRYFVTRIISTEAESEVIETLAQTLTTNNFDLLPVLRQLFGSEHFFDADDSTADDEFIGALIKSPLDLSLQAFSFFGLPIPDPVAANQDHYMAFWNGAVIERLLGRAGMELFFPPDVAGYPGYFQDPGLNRQFFNSATIISRYKLPEVLLTGTNAWGPGGGDSIGTQLDLAAWVRDSGVISDPSDSNLLVQELAQYLFPEEPDAERMAYFRDTIFLDMLPPADWNYEWQNYLSSGDDSEVKIPLGRLLNAVLYAPEYQVF